MNIPPKHLRALAVAGSLAATLAVGLVATAQPPARAKSAARPAAPRTAEDSGKVCQHGQAGERGHRPPPFEQLDTDGDGKLSEVEAMDIPPVIEQGFDTLDTDADGFLSREELPPPPGHGRGRGGRGENGERGGHRPPTFAELDADGDGKLSQEEAAHIPPVREEGFETFDTNNDGSLSESELPAPPEEQGEDFEGGPHGMRPPRFEDSDANGDGKLSPAEAEGIPPVDDEGFETIDTDGDGFLTQDELPPPPGMRHQARNARGGDQHW